MKEILRKILPAPVWKVLSSVRSFLIITWMKVKAKIRNSSLFIHLMTKMNVSLKRKIEKLQFEINITEHCNLNCKGCGNFSPLVSEPEMLDVNEFERDLSRLGEIFAHECNIIFLIGGEPLLHPRINDIVRIARENFHKGTIALITNGILLPRMNEEFYKACHDNDIAIWISAYPIKIDIEKIRALTKEFDVKLEWAWGYAEKSVDTFYGYPLNLAGDSDAVLNFTRCKAATNCIALKHGRLFACSIPANIHHFSRKFGLNIDIDERNYTNIYDDFTGEEIFERLRKPIPACRYCKVAKDGEFRFFEWGNLKAGNKRMDLAKYNFHSSSLSFSKTIQDNNSSVPVWLFP